MPELLRRRDALRDIGVLLGFGALRFSGCGRDGQPPRQERPEAGDAGLKEPDLAAVHAEWMRHVLVGEKISRENPALVHQIFEEARVQPEKEAPPLKKTGFRDYASFSRDDLVGLVRAHAYSHERIRDLIVHLRGFPILPERTKSLPEQAYSDVAKLLDDEKFSAFTKKLYEDNTLECDETSAVYTAAYIARLLNEGKGGEIQLVTGIYLHPKLAPNGTYHQWLRIGDRIIDPSIYYDLGYRELSTGTNYVPLVTTRLRKEGTRVMSERTINCYPSGMEEAAFNRTP